MNKQGKTYIILIIIAVLVIVFFEYTKPKDVNWFPSYAKQHKIPFGTYVFQQQLEQLFSKLEITNIERPPYEYLNDNDSISGTYIFINNNVSFDITELETLLNWTSKGNTLFIASEIINEKLLDTLGGKNKVISNLNNLDNIYKLQLKNKTLKNKTTYHFDKANFLYYFNKVDTLNTAVIGVVDNETTDGSSIKNEHINVIKQGFGKGNIMLSTFPQAFTNYFMLTSPNQNYTAGLLSYFDASKPIYIDQYYKSGKTFYSSPMYVILNTKELKWAYYIMLIGVVVYIIFQGKRKQRAIPVVNPLTNKTLDFTRTIANMYYENGKHDDIAQHKIQHFLEYIRVHLHINTDTIDPKFLKEIAIKSNNSMDDTKLLFNTIENITNTSHIDAKKLEHLNTLINTFKSKNTWKTKI